MLLQVGVKVLLVNDDNKFLLIRRSENIYKEVQQKWDIPGGRIDPGSTLLNNLAREVKEETGLILFEDPFLIGAQDIILGSERHIVRLTYIGKAFGEIQLSEEHTKCEWFYFEELLLLEDLDKYLRDLLNKIDINKYVESLRQVILKVVDV